MVSKMEKNQPCILKGGVERARRHEAARLTGGAATVSAISFIPVPNHAAARKV